MLSARKHVNYPTLEVGTLARTRQDARRHNVMMETKMRGQLVRTVRLGSAVKVLRA